MSATPHNVAGTSFAPMTELSGAVRDEFRHLRSTCGLYDLGSRAHIRLTGGDRVRWLNGMITNNVRDLAIGHGVYAFLLNPQGHILGDLYAYNRGEQFVVVTDHGQREKIVSTFDHYIIMDDVEVANVSDQLSAIGLAGPNAESVLGKTGLEAPHLQPLQIADNLSWQQTKVTIVRGERDAFPSYEIWVAPEDAASLREALQRSGAMLVGQEALEIYRILLGIPVYGKDIRERDLPQETEQQRALNFNKGCYVGQEIVERIRSRGAVHRKFTGFTVTGAAPAPGTKIQAQAKDVGEITSSAVISSPDGEHTVALGYIRREVGVPGKEVEIAGSRAVVADLPFHDPLTR